MSENQTERKLQTIKPGTARVYLESNGRGVRELTLTAEEFDAYCRKRAAELNQSDD